MSVAEIFAVILMAAGELCILLALLGVFRLHYVLNRMHATTIADTLGTLLIFLGGILCWGFSWTSVKLVAVVLFQWITAPVAGHMIARVTFYSEERDVADHAEILFDREEEE